MSGGLGIPRIDFSPLSKLGEDLALGLNESERRRAVQGLGVAPGDSQFLPKLGQALVGLGDVNGALAVARLQENAGDRAYQRTRDASNDAFRQAESARAQGNADRSFGLQERHAKYDEIYRDRADARADQSLAIQQQAATRREFPAGFEANPEVPGGVRPIAGGPQDLQRIQAVKTAEEAAKSTQEKALPAELGARVALSQSFLDQVPELRRQVQEGGVTGPVDGALARSGYGQQGEILRRIKSGSEAIVRNLTGAGMNQAEAEARVKQYEPAWNDNAETVTRKLDMLTEQLQRIEAEAYRGRGIPANRVGKNPFFEAPRTASQTQPGGAAPQAAAPGGPRMVDYAQVPEGKRFRRDGRIFRRVNGQDVPE